MRRMLNIGVLLTLGYIGTAGTANVLLANYLKRYDPFCITAICFLATTAYFTLVNSRRLLGVYQLCKANRHAFILLNMYAAINWLSFYGALSILEPVVVITIVNVVGTIINHMASSRNIPHLLIYGFAILLLFVYSIAPHWPKEIDTLYALGALLLAHISGYTIVKTVVLSKQLYQIGLQASDVMGVRFYLLIFVCIAKMTISPSAPWTLDARDISTIILLGSLSSVMPVYMLQVAYQYATAKQIILTLSFAPLFIFLLQFFMAAHPPSLWIALSVVLVSLTSMALISLPKSARKD